jgi:hypothetical protein
MFFLSVVVYRPPTINEETKAAGIADEITIYSNNTKHDLDANETDYSNNMKHDADTNGTGYSSNIKHDADVNDVNIITAAPKNIEWSMQT